MSSFNKNNNKENKTAILTYKLLLKKVIYDIEKSLLYPILIENVSYF